MATAWAALLDAGLSVGRGQVSWRDLEPAPGSYDAVALGEVLEPLEDDGLAIFLTLETMDSGSFEIPEDLLEDELTLAEGRAFDDPVILQRFSDLLAWMIPRLAGRGVYALSVGNEPDNTITDQPALAAPLAVFTEHARRTVHALDPSLAVSMTLTFGATEASFGPPIVEASDFLAINYYGQLPDGGVKTNDEVDADLDAIATLAAGRPVIIQELGCFTGYESGDSVVDSSEEQQRDSLAHVLSRFEEDPETFRAAYWFLLIGFSPELAELLAQPICDEGFVELCVLVEELFATYGILRWDDGSPLPAFATLEAAL